MRELESSINWKLPNPLRGIIFDCDGVLIDSRSANIIYYNALLREMGYPPMSADMENFVHMASFVQALHAIIRPGDLSRLREAMRRVSYDQLVFPNLSLEPGIYDLLVWLRDNGIHRAVHTNRDQGMWDILEEFNLQGLFDPVMTADIVKAKPHPEGVFAILAEWNVNAEEVLFLGDSSADAEAAQAAGVFFAAYKNTLLDVPNHINNFDVLLKKIAALRGQDRKCL
jgi:phosphoglycolate phosphatase